MIEDLALGHSVLVQDLLQVVVLDVLVAFERELLDRRPLEHDNHERVAIATELEVLKEAGLEDRSARFAQPLLGNGIADVDRQIVIDRAIRNSLGAFDAEVADDERLHGRESRHAYTEAGDQHRQLHETLSHHEPKILLRSL